jgi:hypothetical protein
VLLGLVLILQGRKAHSALAFPICFLIFSIPSRPISRRNLAPPAERFRDVEQPSTVGYPIARSGVVPVSATTNCS